jgi:cytochrome c
MRTIFCILGFAAVSFGLLGSSIAGRAQTLPNRPPAFAQCLACHTTEHGRNGFGPSLAGVSGRQAGSLPGYGYSAALQSSGLIWNGVTLDRWLTSPQRTVPGTRMPFSGIADPAQRKQVVDYVLTLK